MLRKISDVAPYVKSSYNYASGADSTYLFNVADC